MIRACFCGNLCYKNTIDGLLDYRIQEPCLSDYSAGFVYRNLGIMEYHNSLIIVKRMKHNHTTWSIKGTNNMVKILSVKFSGSLDESARDIFADYLTSNSTESPLKDALKHALEALQRKKAEDVNTL